MGARGFEVVLLLFWLVVPALAALALYWVVRLAVRHALRDARGEGHGPARASDRPVP